jgi:DNA-binding CsgD family transcriptional regulator/PAS domain-containing protein
MSEQTLLPPGSSVEPEIDAAALSSLIGDIYDAALDHAFWPQVLQNIARFVDGAAAGILSKDSVSKAGNVHHNYGVEPRYLELYHDTYWRFDPLSPLLFSGIGEVTCNRNYVSESEFSEGRFYKEWIRPQGWVDAANVVLEKSSTSFALLSIIRSEAQGPVDDRMRRRVDLITPHMRRSVLIGKVIDLKGAEAAAFSDTLDTVAAGVILFDVDAHIVHTNRAARDMLATGDLIREAGGGLAATDRAADLALREALSAAGHGDAALGTRGIAVPLDARGGGRFVAHILPMTGRGPGDAASHGAAAAMFVHSATLDAPSAPEVIARTYGLTPSELRVLRGVVEAGGVAETAEMLGIGEATVKTHLHRIFGKTDTSRQADLVKLVAGYSSPLSR